MLDAIVLSARFALAGVLGVAGVAKLSDGRGSREAARAFGFPAATTGFVAVALPLAELVLAALLLPAATARYAGAGALVLLLAFAGGIGMQLARGRKPECHCFGQLHSAPAGPLTIARNIILAGVAGAVALSPGPQPEAFGWLAALGRAEALALVALLVAGAALAGSTALCVRLLRQHGRLLLRLDSLEQRLAAEGIAVVPAPGADGLPVGAQAPQIDLRDGTGHAVPLRDLATGRPAVLVFTDRDCAPCRALVPVVAEWQREYADEVNVAVVGIGPRGAVAQEAVEHGLTLALEDADQAAYRALRIAGTPGAVAIAPDGTIASPARSGRDGVEAVLDEALALAEEDDEGLPVGAPAPALRLPGPDGGLVDLAGLRGREAVVLFWDPGCGFCRDMRDDLRNVEATHRPILVVSAGSPEAVREERFACPVGLDPHHAAADRFGVDGTPVAVLVDGDGAIASPPTIGADAILGLIKHGTRLTIVQHHPATG